MFERYTEKARRTIFFARYEASQFGSPQIEPEHLLLGLFREDKELRSRFLESDTRFESMRDSIERRASVGPKIATSVDLPLSHPAKRVLAYAAEESERMQHAHIDTPHLLLGLLREESFAAQLLRDQGLTVESVREQARQSETAVEQGGGTASSGALDQWIADREARGGIWAIAQRRAGNRISQLAIYAGERPKENGPEDLRRLREQLHLEQRTTGIPFLCIEIIRNDGFSEVRGRCDAYFAAGVAQIWLLEPSVKRAYTVTKAEGLCEFRGDVLRIADPPLEMDLKTIFG